jgi:RNA polymerase sigma-70 factor (ECF subfamily)
MEQLIHEELQQALSNALQELSHGQREVFVLHTDGGLTYREISESLNLSVGTVMSRLFYARQKLLKLLGKRAEL